MSMPMDHSTGQVTWRGVNGWNFYTRLSLRDLVIFWRFDSLLALALGELTGNMVTGVLPALRQVFADTYHLSRPNWESFVQFITVQQLSGHPVAVHPAEAGRS